MEIFNGKQIPDSGNPITRKAICNIARHFADIYIEWRDQSSCSTETYTEYKGCYDIACSQCILDKEKDFRPWMAHLRLLGD